MKEFATSHTLQSTQCVGQAPNSTLTEPAIQAVLAAAPMRVTHIIHLPFCLSV